MLEYSRGARDWTPDLVPSRRNLPDLPWSEPSLPGMAWASWSPPSLPSLPSRRALAPLIPLALLGALVWGLGADPFVRSLNVLAPGPVAAALILGAVTTTAQALRWRTVAKGYGAAPAMSPGRAVRECYRSALLNTVLPGGVAGDAVRAWRHRVPRRGGLRSSAGAVVGERVSGTAVLLAAVAAMTAWTDLRVAAVAAVGSGVAVGIATPSLRRLPVRAQLGVWAWSVVALLPLVVLFSVAAAHLGTARGTATTAGLALVALAGMAVPAGIGGFGPREAVAAVSFGSIGLGADAGVATAAAYGVLAAVSALPGALVMLVDGLSRTPGGSEVEFDADVVTEHEPAGGGAQGICQPIFAREAQPRHAVAYQ